MQRPGGVGATSRAVVNTKFLINTVHGIGSHNRREEVEDCWRQRRLEQQDHKQRTRLSNATGDRRGELPYQKAAVEEAAASVDDTRTFWAEQKQRVMTAARTASPIEGALLSTMQAVTSVERSGKKTKLGKVPCRDRDNGNASSIGAKLLVAEKKKRRKRKDDKKDKNKSKHSKKEKRKRECQNARDADNNNVEESHRTRNLESDVGGAKRKKHKKRKEQK